MSEHRHFDADTGKEIFTPINDCYRCVLSTEEEIRHLTEYMQELEKALMDIIALPDADYTPNTSDEDSAVGFNEGLEVCREIAREVLYER